MRVPAFFNPRYAPAKIPTLARLATARDALLRLGLIEDFLAENVDLALLAGLHDSDYLHGFLEGIEPHASRQGIRWSPEVRDATLNMLGGQLQAVRHVLAHGGVAMNIARGFHHAHPAGGSGFCPLNGLALVAHAMPDRRVMVIDCDEHGGNGTEEFAARLPNLFATSIFGTRFGCRGGVRSWAFRIAPDDDFGVYEQALREVAGLVDRIQPDIILYQAGADCHYRDPKSTVCLSTREMFRRDLAVFRLVHARGLPLVFVVAGGYQSAAGVARLNVNTVRAARSVFAGSGCARA